MRKYTFLFSMVAHLGVVAAVVLTTLVVTHTLPGVPPMWDYVVVRPEMPDPPPLPAPRPATRAIAEPIAAVPLEPPDAILAEPEIPRVVDDRPSTQIGDLFGDPRMASDGIGNGDPVPPPPPSPVPKPVVPQRVGGTIVAPTKIHHVPPAYPAIALAARVQGVVTLDAVIGEDGVVRELRVLKSIPLLDQAALDAVRQWRFTPTLLNGQRTPVIMTVTVSFKLN